MKAKRPHCACCGNVIPKRTHMITVYANKERGDGPPAETLKKGYIVGKFPSKKELLQALPAGNTITSLSMGPQGESVWSFNIWDGHTYAPVYDYFCRMKCAAEMGRRAMEPATTKRSAL